jgi:hypothetical protein
LVKGPSPCNVAHLTSSSLILSAGDFFGAPPVEPL